MITLRIWLLQDYLLTQHRMRVRVKFCSDFKHHYRRSNSLRAAYFLARNTL